MSLRVIVVDAANQPSRQLASALRAAGFTVLAVVPGEEDLFDRVATLHPDAIIIDADSPRRDTLEHLANLNDRYPRPIVMFAEHAEEPDTALAVRLGISAYVVDGLSPTLVRSLVQVAILHYHDHRHLEAALQRSQANLEQRRLVDRAKCLLMEHHGLREQEAYHRLRRQAMDAGEPVWRMAQRLLQQLRTV